MNPPLRELLDNDHSVILDDNGRPFIWGNRDDIMSYWDDGVGLVCWERIGHRQHRRLVR